jgi:hypothetical protein
MSRTLHSKSLGSGKGSCLTSSLGLEGSICPSSSGSSSSKQVLANDRSQTGYMYMLTHRSVVRVASPRTAPSSYINARKVMIGLAA